MRFAFIALAYLLGSISFAVVMTRLFRLPDPRTFGSGNPGATNVLRTGRRGVAALTLLGDAGKGWLAVWLAACAGADANLLALVAVAVFLGHLFPLFHGFKGGKGVATALGVLLALDWKLAVVTAAVWLAIALTLRISSLAALVAATVAPLAGWWLLPAFSEKAAVLVIAAMLIFRHRSNIANLLGGRESRIGQR